MSIFVGGQVTKSGYASKLGYNFFLRKLTIGVRIKIVAQIPSYKMSGQRALNSIPMTRYAQNTK